MPLVTTRLQNALITDQVALVDPAKFTEAVDALDPATSLDDLLHAAMAAYMANERVAWIPFVHAVTGPAAVRLLLPYLDPGVTDAAVAYAWQAVGAIQSAYGRVPPMPLEPSSEPDWADLADRAVESGDEHVIKLLEVCQRERLPVPGSLTA